MNYEKKYNKLVEAVKQLQKANQSDEGIQNWVNDNVPELRESEEERIRKDLITFLDDIWHLGKNANFDKWDKADCSDWIAWLEKQSTKEPADKVESKFHEGDWVILTAGELSTTLQIVNVDTNKKLYWFNDSSYLPIVDEECLHLWTIQDARDGDVLQLGKVTAIFKEFIANGNCRCYCSVWEGKVEIPSQDDDEGYGCYNTTPATKEQRDTLFAKMKESGYEWDAEKKELKKIEEEYNGEDYGIDGLWHAQRILEKTLGEVDGYQSDDGILEHKCAISAVKELYGQKSVWNEEDETKLKSILFFTEAIISEEEFDWLKSLKQRYTWKPSEKQMRALRDMNLTGNISYAGQGQTLIELYNELKKLTE